LGGPGRERKKKEKINEEGGFVGGTTSRKVQRLGLRGALKLKRGSARGKIGVSIKSQKRALPERIFEGVGVVTGGEGGATCNKQA